VGALIGTPHYMSPEQVKGIGEVDFHADLWALGVIAFQCVTGELPFDSEGVGDLLIKITLAESPVPSKVYPGAPANFDAWFARACTRDITKRFQSAREMAMALAGAVGVIDGAAPRAPTMRPPATPAGAGNATLPRPPRAVTEQLDADDWEEVDPFDEDDDAPTQAVLSTPPPVVTFPSQPPGPAVAPVPPSPEPHHVGAASGPKPQAPAEPRAPLKATGSSPRKPSPAEIQPSIKVPAPAPAQFKAVPRPTTNAPPGLVAKGSAPPVAAAAAPLAPVPVAPTLEGHDGHEIVDFDETAPAHDPRASIAVPLVNRAAPPPSSLHAALVPLSEPPPPPPMVVTHDRAEPPPSGRSQPAQAVPVEAAPISSPPSSQRDSPNPSSAPPIPGPPSSRRGLIAPVMAPPPRVDAAAPARAEVAGPLEVGAPASPRPPRPPLVSPPSSDAVAQSIPRPPSSSRNLPPPSPSAAPVVTPVETHRALLTEPPPELDGSKRRRMVRYLVAGLVLFAAGITWTVVRSQLDFSSGVAVPNATVSVAPPPPPPPLPSMATATAAAVDPGKVTHPGKPTPSGPAPAINKGPMRGGRIPRQPNDGTIVVPEPDEP
jgi:serine/threonine-protein kinase